MLPIHPFNSRNEPKYNFNLGPGFEYHIPIEEEFENQKFKRNTQEKNKKKSDLGTYIKSLNLTSD